MPKRREIGETLKKSDSWSGVEDLGPETKNGRYGVTVFFNSHEEADDFREDLAAELDAAS